MFDSENNEQIENVDTSTETTDENQTSEAQRDPLEYEAGKKLSEKLSENPDAVDRSNLPELEKLERFKYQGKELTAKQLQDMILMRSDYTRKTQEIAKQRKDFETNQKYYENLPYDLKAVSEDPTLVDAFKKTYPKQFHAYLDRFAPAQDSPTQEPKATKAIDNSAKEQIADPRLEELYQNYEKQQQETADAKVNGIFDKLVSKYPQADEARVIAQTQHLLRLHKEDPEGNPKVDEKVIEKLFKRDEETTLKRYKDWQSNQLKRQREANARGAGVGAGGGIPGQAPNLPRSIREATKAALQDPAFN